ncbi:MAG: DNA alkylation repair protein [Prosthecobacter sp.]
MTLDETMQALSAKASATTKKTLLRHGAPEPLFGVRIGDMKPIVRQIKGDQELAMQLYATGNSDAMYLAGLVADGSKMKRAEVERWAKKATWQMISGTIVPWVAAEHAEGMDMALQWIDSPKETIAVAGWGTLCNLVTTTPDEKLPIKELDALLKRVVKTLKSSPDLVRYAMNNFVICCGTYVAPLADKAVETARKLGKVEVDMGDTACQVPEAESYILKSRRGAPIAPKRKTTRC